jgi:hypothetical protein
MEELIGHKGGLRTLEKRSKSNPSSRMPVRKLVSILKDVTHYDPAGDSNAPEDMLQNCGFLKYMATKDV